MNEHFGYHAISTRKVTETSPSSLSESAASRCHHDPALRAPNARKKEKKEGIAPRSHQAVVGYQLCRSECAEEKNLVFPIYSLLYTDAGRVRASGVTWFAFEGTVQNVTENHGAGARLACRRITRPGRMMVVEEGKVTPRRPSGPRRPRPCEPSCAAVDWRQRKSTARSRRRCRRTASPRCGCTCASEASLAE